MIDKQVKTTADAVAGVRDGSIILVAGFGAVGVADNLLEALHEQGAKELTIVANNSGNGDHGLARLINSGRVRKVICSYPRSGDYSAFLNAYRANSLELELVPQGIISERMRCPRRGPWRFLLAGVGGNETRRRQGNPRDQRPPACVRKAAEGRCRADQGQQGRPLGQPDLHQVGAGIYNPVMAMAADLTVAEVDGMVELGALDPEAVATPSIFVDRVVVVGAQA